MAEKKITKLEIVEMMLADVTVATNEVYVAYLENEKALLLKKKASKKSTKAQTENAGIKDLIVNALATIGKAVTVTELQKATDELTDFSNQKISALLHQLVESGEVVKTVDKGKSYFEVV